MFSSLLTLLALGASLISAEESIPYKLKTESDSTFLYITPIDDCKYKVSATGYSGAGSKFHWTDVQNINNSTIVATDYGPNALLDVYAVRRPESLGMAQVFVRTNLTDEERTFTQQISIADGLLRYGGYEGVPYVFYFCNTEVTDDFVDLPHTLFIRRSDICLPEGCWDTVLDITSQGLRGNS